MKSWQIYTFCMPGYGVLASGFVLHHFYYLKNTGIFSQLDFFAIIVYTRIVTFYKILYFQNRQIIQQINYLIISTTSINKLHHIALALDEKFN